jgi:mitogen-activated protein kinase kinase
MGDLMKPKTMKRKNLKGLALSAPPPKPAPSAGDAQVPGGIANDDRQDTLEIGVEFQLDLKAEDLIVLRELGSGNGGTCSIRQPKWLWQGRCVGWLVGLFPDRN